MTTTTKSGISLNLLMGDAIVLLQAIKARAAQMHAVDTESIDDDALAELYEDSDTLQRLHDYIQHEFDVAFGAPPPDSDASYEDDLKQVGQNKNNAGGPRP